MVKADAGEGSVDVARLKADLVEAERMFRQQGDHKMADRLAETIATTRKA